MINILKKIFFNTKLLFVVSFICLFTVNNNIAYGQFVQIESILADACAGTQEGENEMVAFHTENSAINVADIRVDGASNSLPHLTGKWPNNTNSFLGWILPGTANYDSAVAKIALINAAIVNCGKLIIPTGGTNGQGLIPAGKKGIIITSTDFSPFADDFSLLSDTLYVVFQKSGNTQGHFTNYGPSAIRYLRLHQISTGTNEDVSYNRSLLVTIAGTPGAEDGGGIRFTDAGVASYYNDGCQAPYIPLSPNWTAPSSMCPTSPIVDLNTLVTGTTGGTWSGTGVTGSNFNPTGLSGSYVITYTVGVLPCQMSEFHTLTVVSSSGATWTAPAALCQTSASVNLNTLLAGTATTGGTWSGTGVTGNTFNPVGLNGSYNVTYTVGSSPCTATETHPIQVVSSAIATWTAPAALCQSSATINLNTLLAGTATTGGTWSGSGVTGNTFDPAGLNGNINVSYSVGTTPCNATENHDIQVVSSAIATWTAPAALCQTSTSVNLNTLLAGTATTGGTWSGTGVTGNTFNPTGLNGNISVTYTVGSSPCIATETHPIQVVSSAIATWTVPATLCQSSATINLNTLLAGTATTGGTWSGSGVTGNTFDPAGLNGNINVSYSVGTTPCNATENHDIQVVSSAIATWTAPAALCQTSASVNLNTLLAGTATTGGTWSGTGVAGNTFSPTGLNGNFNITYTVGTAPCVATETHPIQVILNANASWVAPVSLCQSSSPLNLNSLLAATTTTGGVWSGVGVTGNSFNPAGQSGNINVTYTVGTAPCSATESHTILVLPNYDASWNAPASICADAAPLDLAQFITGDIGGTWVGQGVVHPQFNPTGLIGSIPISYIVSGAAGCPDTVTHSIIVTPIPSAAWSAPVVICKNLNTFDLNNLITGDQGGIWSGVGVSSNLLNLASVGDSLEVTYTINSSGCISTVTGKLYFSYVNADFSIAPSSGTAPLNTTTLNLSQNAVSYDWDFGNGFTSSETNPSSIYTLEGTYYVWLVATSALGCQDSTFKVVNVDESADFIPNAVTPNGDGLNDQFYPIISKIVDNYQMMIFNRWGELIFETTHQLDKWDGDYQGKNVAMGVYFYVIKYTSRGIDYYYNGTVSVIN